MLVNVDVYDMAREMSRASLYESLKLCWGTIIAETPVWNWHIEYLCNEIQEVLERVFRRQKKEYDLIVNVPPSSSKSTIISIMAPMWAWARDPSIRTIVGTHQEALGTDLSRKSREMLLTELPDIPGMSFADLHGIKIKKDQDNKLSFGTIGNGERVVCTVGGKSPMGKHAHLLIVDDPIDPEAVFSDANLLKANRYLTNTMPSRMVDKTITPMITVMQRLHQNDPTGNLIKKYETAGMPYKHICIPAEATQDVRPANLINNYKDGLLDPVRLPRHILNGVANTSAYTYASQYLQTPIPVGGGLFKTDKLRERITSDVPKMQRVVRYWDKASTENAGDYTAGVKMGVDADGNYWILNVRRFQHHSDERERAIQATATVDGKACMIGMEQEPGSSGVDSITSSIRGLAGYTVKPEKVTGDKGTRAEPLATQVNAGNVYMKEAAWNEDFLEEAAFFPNSTHKDQCDAAAGAFRLLANLGCKIARGVF